MDRRSKGYLMVAAAIGKYRRQAETIQDANIVANLQRIIQDEEHHVRLFRSMLAEVAET